MFPEGFQAECHDRVEGAFKSFPGLWRGKQGNEYLLSTKLVHSSLQERRSGECGGGQSESGAVPVLKALSVWWRCTPGGRRSGRKCTF